MRQEQYRRMVLAAKELMRLQARGHDLDPLTVKWAQDVVASKQKVAPVQTSYRADKVYDAMQAHGPSGMLASEIRERSGLGRAVCAQVLCYMARNEQVAMLKVIGGRSRYFMTKRQLETGRAYVQAEEDKRRAALAAAKARAAPPPRPPPPKPAKHARPSVPAKPRARARKADAGKLREQGVYVAGMLPANVTIQTLPPFHDARFEAVPPVKGIGAVKEWQKLVRKLPRRRNK